MSARRSSLLGHKRLDLVEFGLLVGDLLGDLRQVVVGAFIGRGCLFEPAFELVVVLSELGDVSFKFEEAGVDGCGFNSHVRVIFSSEALEVCYLFSDGRAQVGFEPGFDLLYLVNRGAGVAA